MHVYLKSICYYSRFLTCDNVELIIDDENIYDDFLT